MSDNNSIFSVDGWKNIITGLGIETRDPSTATAFVRTLFLQPPTLEALYVENAIAGRIIDFPVDTATREGVELNAPEADADDSTAALLDALQGAMASLSAFGEFNAAMKWGELYGGGLVVYGLDDGRPASDPVDLAALRSVDWIENLDRWSVWWDASNPDYYLLNPPAGTTTEVQVGERVHVSRTWRFGSSIMLPPRQRPLQLGWDEPKLTRVFNALKGEGTAYDTAESSIQRTSLPVFKIKNLASQVLSNGIDYVRNRMMAHAMTMSFLKGVFVDAEGEDFKYEQNPVNGLAELLDRFPLRVAAAAGFPMSLLYGVHPGGFSNEDRTGERFFYGQVRATIQMQRLLPAVNYLLTLLMNASAGPTAGQVFPVGVDFPPLWQPTPEEQANIRSTNAATDQIYLDEQVLTPLEVRESRFGGRRYGNEIMLGTPPDAITGATGTADLTPEQKIQQARLALELLHTPSLAGWAAGILGAPVPTAAQMATFNAAGGTVMDGRPVMPAASSALVDTTDHVPDALRRRILSQRMDAHEGGRSVWLSIRAPEAVDAARGSLSPIDDSTAHVTLLFIGDVSGREQELLAVLQEEAAQTRPDRAYLGELRTLINAGQMLVAYQRVRLERGTWGGSGVAGLRRRLVERLEGPGGFGIGDVAPYDWMPHLTRAYIDDVQASYVEPRIDGTWFVGEIEVFGLGAEPLTIPLGGL